MNSRLNDDADFMEQNVVSVMHVSKPGWLQNSSFSALRLVVIARKADVFWNSSWLICCPF
jgi:hypothetical protein